MHRLSNSTMRQPQHSDCELAHSVYIAYFREVPFNHHR